MLLQKTLPKVLLDEVLVVIIGVLLLNLSQLTAVDP